MVYDEFSAYSHDDDDSAVAIWRLISNRMASLSASVGLKLAWNGRIDRDPRPPLLGNGAWQLVMPSLINLIGNEAVGFHALPYLPGHRGQRIQLGAEVGTHIVIAIQQVAQQQ